MSALPHSEACERNKEPILEVLRRELPARGIVLEIGSGTGQHVVHFARYFPRLSWQPSDRAGSLDGLAARIAAEGPVNVLPALEFGVQDTWPGRRYDAVFSANTAHIMSWPEVQAMFRGVALSLRPDRPFCLYGPFNENGAYTAPGNEVFDRGLKERDPAMGLRDIEALESLARGHHLALQRRHPMPANNQLLVFTGAGNDGGA
jgi:SAM-dependent methyltransferase